MIKNRRNEETNPMTNEFERNILELVNDCFMNREIPKEAQFSRIMVFNKKPLELPRIKNTRFIAINSILQKIIEAITLNRIKPVIEKQLAKS